MQQRRVTAPDGTRWIVGRRWLLGRPRYLGFRFGQPRQEPEFEAAARVRPLVERKPAPTMQPTPPPVRYRDRQPTIAEAYPGSVTSRHRRPTGGGGGWVLGRSRGAGRRTGGGGVIKPSGGGIRLPSGGGGRRSRSSGGGRRGGGGGAGAAGGILAALAKFLKYLLIGAAVVVAALIVVFVLLPALLFLAHYLAFWVVVAATIGYRAMTNRPWIVEMEEAEGFRVRAWRVAGWARSKETIDAVAEALRRGADPEPPGAEPVDIVNLAEHA